MANYVSNWRAPTAPADLLGSSGGEVTLGTTYTVGSTSAEIEISGTKYLMLYVYCTALGGAARLDLQLEVAEFSGSSDWVPLQTESVSSGTATQDPYEIQKAVTATGLVLAAAIPVRGFDFWRIKMKADAGTPDVYVRYATSGGPV